MSTETLPDRFADDATKMERALVGCVLIDAGRCHEAMATLRGSDFADRDLGALFDLLASLSAQGQPISDTGWLVSAIAQTRPFKAIGSAGIAELVSDSLNAAHVNHYAAEIIKHSKRRKIRELAFTMLESVNEAGLEPDHIAAEAMGALTSAIHSAGGSDQCTIGEAAQAACDRMSTSRSGNDFGIATGIRCIDPIAGGMQDGELIILAARPSIGKTTLAMDAMIYAASHGKRVLFASCEMNRIALGNRLLSRETGIDTETLGRGNLTNEQLSKVKSATERLQGLPFTIWESSAPTIDQIAGRARAHAAKHGLDLVCIDHIGLLRASHNARSRYEAQSEIAKDLKTLATSLQKPVLALCQLNREGEGEIPRLHMLRDSGCVEENADKVWFLHRDRSGSDTQFIVAKYRQGSVGSTAEGALQFDKDRCSFRDANYDFLGYFT
jgi:replicative DNA helicase